jgi:hypothetical protein
MLMLIIMYVFKLFDIKRFYFRIQERHQIHGCFSEKALMHEYAQVYNVRCLEKILLLSQVESISEEKSLNKASQPFLFIFK